MSLCPMPFGFYMVGSNVIHSSHNITSPITHRHIARPSSTPSFGLLDVVVESIHSFSSSSAFSPSSSLLKSSSFVCNILNDSFSKKGPFFSPCVLSTYLLEQNGVKLKLLFLLRCENVLIFFPCFLNAIQNNKYVLYKKSPCKFATNSRYDRS